MAENAGDVAESPHPNLRFCNHSHVNAIDSEMPVNSCSSLPSEPPYIGNWFSSYVYESPVLDSEDGVKGIVSGESEWQKVGFIYEELGRKKEENWGELRNRTDKDASAFDEKISSFGDEKEQNQSLDKGESNSFVTKKGENEGLDGKLAEDHDFVPFKYDASQCLSSMDSSQKLDDGFSFPSEPPDIGNWFSSYCYESPALDTGEELNGYVSGKNESKKVSFTSQEISNKKEDDLGEIINHVNKDASVFGGRDNKYQNQSVNKGQNNLFVTKIGENERLGGKPAKHHDLFKDDATLCLTNVDSPKKLETNFSILSKLKKSLSANHEESKENSFERKDCKANHLEGKDCAGKVDHHHEDSTSPSIEEEKVRNVTTNGFVSTKKKNFTSENRRSSLKSCQKKSVSEMQTRLVRRPLFERTNILNEVVAPEITGKWKCPQKSKPDLGPPMKQQRLERWIHRV